ncbi:MAG: hypothetical protein GTO24_04785, partial [candidate division Zixibacteria bacterium]|nr:hypothetical protein [candidate division Zixibacteria bacterium]
HGPKNPVVMGQGELARIGFYGDGTFLEIPRNEDLHESLKRGKVDFLAINEKNIEDTHPGLIDSLDSERFEKEVVLGMPSGQYVIIIYSVRS